MNVLIVDDDPSIRLLLAHVLRAAGHVPCSAADAAEAEAACSEQRPDVVLFDVRLGADDGIATAERLLARFEPPPPHLFFLTGSGSSDEVERMQRLHPRAVLSKPFDPTTFVARLEALLPR